MIIFGKLRVQQGIPIVPKLKTELLEWRIYCERIFGKLPEYVFSNRPGKRLSENAVACVFKRLRAIFNFKDVRCCCHDCRRYYASSLIRNGADAFTVQGTHLILSGYLAGGIARLNLTITDVLETVQMVKAMEKHVD
jgi:integrase